MSRLGKYMIASIFSAWVGTIGQSAEKSEKTRAIAPGAFQIQLSKDRLSLDANEAPLVQIFQEIGKQAKITLDSNIGPEEKITMHLDRVPLEEGIKQLAKNVTVFYTENSKDKPRRIERVAVLLEGKEAAPMEPKASAPPVTVNKPAPQPEPFKFEFDPGKFAEKEKARKQP